MAKATQTKTARSPEPDTSKKRRLGRGLSGLLGAPVAVAIPAEPPASASPATSRPAPLPSPSAHPETVDTAPADAVLYLDIRQVRPNPNQPRKIFDESALAQLAASIRSAGVMQPIIARRVRGSQTFEIVAGERRWRAAQIAGLESIPALVRDLTDAQTSEWALIENLQREDLGAMEKAGALRALADRFGLTHAQIADRVGLERATVTNLIRLTDLEPEIAQMLDSKLLTMGHGRALLSVPEGSGRLKLAHRAIRDGWSVRALEQFIESRGTTGAITDVSPARTPSADTLSDRQAGVNDLEKRLGDHLSTKVKLHLRKGGASGRLVIEFFDLDHFDLLMHKMGFSANSSGTT